MTSDQYAQLLSDADFLQAAAAVFLFLGCFSLGILVGRAVWA